LLKVLLDVARVTKGTTMENAKHIGGIWALAVALGLGMAVANSPAVASAKPADSDKGASHDSGSTSSDSTSSDTPSAKTATSASSDPDSRLPRPRKPHVTVDGSGGSDTSTTTGSSASALSTGATTTPATADAPGTDARRNGRGSTHPASGNTSMKTSQRPAAINAPVADLAVRDSSLDVASTTRSAAATPFAAPAPMSTVITPSPADPLSRLVSTVISAVLSPFANSAPTAPVQSPAEWTLLAFARREFEQASTPSTAVANTVGTTAADPDFITSTHGFFGLFSVTSAADPDDNHFVAFVLKTPFFTNVLTSGTDPENNLGFGAASTGVAGQTVNTFMSPFLNFSIGVPFEDPFAALFTELVRQGF
jgi:hypothetical protein